VDLVDAARMNPGGRVPRVVALTALAVAVALPYLPSLANGFVWLDHAEIVEGRLTVSGLAEAVGLFADDRNFHGYHRPLYNLAHSLDRAFWGDRPFGYHLSSLALHVLNVLLAMALVEKLTGSRTRGIWIALLWGLHPVNTACVGLIHAKADLLATFSLLATACLVVLPRRPSVPAQAAAAFAYVCALHAKETAFLYPLAIALLAPAWWRREPLRRCLAPHLALVALFAGVGGLLRMSDADSYASPVVWDDRLLTFAAVYLDYLGRLTVPLGLFVGDTVTLFSARSPLDRTLIVGAALGVAGLQTLLAWRSPRLRPWILLFNVGLLPVAQIVPILHFRADRFLYLPSLAFVGFCVEAADRAFGSTARGRRILPLAFACLAVAYAGLTAHRSALFRDDLTLFTAELATVPDYREGLLALALHHDRRGAPEEAAPLYERARVPIPGRISYVDGHVLAVNYSNNLLARGLTEDAYVFLQEQVDLLRPEVAAHGRYNLAVAAHRTGRDEHAVELLQSYVTEFPRDARAHLLLGVCARRSGGLIVAEEAFVAFLRLAPAAPERPAVIQALAQLRAARPASPPRAPPGGL